MARRRTTTDGESAYRVAEAKYADPEEFYEYLEDNYLLDLTLCLGYYLKRAERHLNLNQDEIAQRAGVSRGFISAVLTGRHQAAPRTLLNVARALEVNPIDLHIAAGWLEVSDADAYSSADRNLLVSIASRLNKFPPDKRQPAVKVVEAILDTLIVQET